MKYISNNSSVFVYIKKTRLLCMVTHTIALKNMCARLSQKDDFQDLLRPSGDISIHQRCINSLLTEVYKYAHGLSPEIMNDVFSTRANIYNTQQFNVFGN